MTFMNKRKIAHDDRRVDGDDRGRRGAKKRGRTDGVDESNRASREYEHISEHPLPRLSSFAIFPFPRPLADPG